MTGPERETLHVLLALVRTVQSDVGEVKDAVISLEERVRGIETASAQQMGVAAGTAAAVASNEALTEKRTLTTMRLLAALASVATITGVIVGVILKFI